MWIEFLKVRFSYDKLRLWKLKKGRLSEAGGPLISLRVLPHIWFGYMMSSALAKKVTWKGSMRVRYSQWSHIAYAMRAEEARNSIQYKPVDFFVFSMVIKNFVRK